MYRATLVLVPDRLPVRYRLPVRLIPEGAIQAWAEVWAWAAEGGWAAAWARAAAEVWAWEAVAVEAEEWEWDRRVECLIRQVLFSPVVRCSSQLLGQFNLTRN